MPKQKERRVRIAVIDYDKCKPELCSYLCQKSCPGVRMGQDTILINELTKKPVISEELCTGCEICLHRCPTKAITIINLATELANPLHQYGENSFRLYRLPLPKENSIVGIIGKNAVGKSTALNIISGLLVPNLGNYRDASPDYGPAIAQFKGNELQGFFQKLKTKGIKISHKRQNITELPNIAKGKVLELLKKADERNALNAIIGQMNLHALLQRNLPELSGGEMQKIAIAECALKNADIYAFDEPSSYLDVSERLKMAVLLRSLAEQGKSVIVIEHDLAVLDYLSDYVHILYGTPGAYGIASNPKSSKEGINEFLQGFIADENIRFREKELHFDVKPASKGRKSKIIAEYPALGKKFQNFMLSSHPGNLYEGEVIGILGANATGKTTFVRMLAGLLKPDNCEVNLKLRVSYKPQYLRAEKNTSVQEAFEKIAIDRQIFESEIDKKLNIKGLYEKQLSELSGGELQKVAVSLCLSRSDADLFLLDEPSAFIDVEDRLKIADVIKSVVDKNDKIAMVVDHDILFQDYISNRLVVFSGTPGANGTASSPLSMHEGMNQFLKEIGVSFRRDPSTGRPRANKPDSVKDAEQKKKGEYYYTF